MAIGSKSVASREIRLRLRLTQEDLAALLQVTRQSVNKELGILVSRGVVSLKYNSITVLDLDALRTLVSRAA